MKAINTYTGLSSASVWFIFLNFPELSLIPRLSCSEKKFEF